MAPEIIMGKPYGPHVDIWSAGVICFTALGGYMPFVGDDDNETFKLILDGTLSFTGEAWKTVSDDAKDFVCKLLTCDPNKRISASAALVHPWIQSYCDRHARILSCRLFRL
eukprot:TRINITY_DN6993_c0_g2_i1.p2 TRINITY_DN6993_c0_g2~~TRINITY_DN6993_c0_g2_i1.p2  ORF type:complete len:111 (-),score=4.61 TRINITY_DN6993_c0_g2_i1:396-728(-)